MTVLDWVFDPTPPSGALQGGNPAQHVFRADLETFVREVLQNSRDQRVADAVKVTFTFNQLTGPAKERFLEAIGWQQLRPHVAGASGSAGVAQVARTLSDGLNQLDDEPLLVLRIDDSGTRGLVGAEDDEHSNYNGLCRNTLLSQDRPERGGSYGLGKAVLWRFSSIFTVLFSSRIDGPPQRGVRLFGRSELPYHKVDSVGYSGAGWFGEPQDVPGGRRAISAWDNVAGDLTAPAGLYRDPELGTGTSILVVAFREPQQEEVRPAPEIAGDVAELAARWFWPTIRRGELQVQVVAQENGQEVFRRPVTLTPEVQGYAGAIVPVPLAQAPLTPGDVAEVELPFMVPARRPSGQDEGQPSVAGHVRLRVQRLESVPGLANKVALTRGAGMVVQYRPVRGVSGERVFQAVLLAGLARGNSPADQAVEAFLRAAEPPAHDDWQATPRVKSEYKQGFGKALADLWQSIDVQVHRLFAEQVADNTPGPELLAKRFRVAGTGADLDGGAGGKTDPMTDGKIRVRNLTAEFTGEVWHFTGTVARVGPAKRWTVRMGLALAEENGQGTPMGIDRLTITAPAADGLVQVRGLETERSLEIAAECGEVSFDGYSQPVITAADSQTAQRTRLNLTVRSASRG